MPSRDELERLLAERDEIDRQLLEKHSREMAVMFTDIVGSTQFFEKKGDIAGLNLLQHHNDILFPVIEKHRGRVVKTIGDAIMAVFDDPPAGARCAAQMQRVLDLDRTQRQAAGLEPIHIRIGVHGGRAMVSGNDVFGDTVNTSSRVSHEAKGDEVLLSKALFDALPAPERWVCAPRGTLTLKGKAEPFPVVALDWRSGPAMETPARPAPTPEGKSRPTSNEVFIVELAVSSGGLKVAVLDGAADKGTVKSYAEVPIGAPELDALASRFGAFMSGSASAAYLDSVRGIGAELFERALSPRAKKHIPATSVEHLRLQLDDELVHVPWELLHDGKDFLALRFSVGRLVSARSDSSISAVKPGPTPSSLHALVVSNPSVDLPAAANEGEAVAGLLRDGFAGEVRHLKGPVTRDAFLAALPGCGLLHFAGHAQAEREKVRGGFLLADGLATASDVVNAFAGSPPMLVFANSCSASTGAGWAEQVRGSGGLASSLLMRGVTHYLAPMWDVPDEDALPFALRFYEQALAGEPFGLAVRHARRALAASHVAPLSFAGYVLYGEPRTSFSAGAFKLGAAPKMRSVSSEAVPALPAGTGISSRTWLAAGAGALVLAALAVGVMKLRTPTPEPPPRLAAVVPPRPVEPKAAPAPPAPRQARTGPVRLVVLPFKNLTGEPKLDVLSRGLGETMTTDITGIEGVQLIEHGAVDDQIDYLEMMQQKYFDPSKRASIGKISGAEVVVVGAFQKAGTEMLFVARLVDAETGEVRDAVRLTGPEKKVFEVQEKFSAQLAEAIRRTKARLRPD